MNHKIMESDEASLLKQAILPVIATAVDGSWNPMGTCWIFSANGRNALAFSAAHIFDAIVRDEERHENSAPTIPDILRPPKPRAINLAKTRMKAVYHESAERTFVVDIVRVYRDGSSDVAVCLLAFQTDAPENIVFKQKLAIHSGPVVKDVALAATGYADMDRAVSFPNSETGIGMAIHYQQLLLNHGKCIEYYPSRGLRGPNGPCFEIDAETKHGMSGGPILHKGYGNLVVGCGVISRGTSFGGQETTMASALWPAYSFDMPELRGENDTQISLIDLAKLNWIEDKSDGPSHFRWIKAVGGDGGVIAWI